MADPGDRTDTEDSALARDFITHDFKSTPYWWDGITPFVADTAALDPEADVVIVGSGYTGLHAALALAKGGRQVLVLEAETLGYGASTRNNGAVIPYLYLRLDALRERFGDVRGVALAQTAVRSLEFFLEFVETHAIDCDLAPYERFFLAHRPVHFERLRHLAELYPRHGIEVGWEPVTGDDIERETGLRGYVGGLRASSALAIHPGKYHRRLVDLAARAGVRFLERCRVTGLSRDKGSFRVETVNGSLSARDVIVATNGYLGSEFPFGKRRLIPVRVFKAASEPLSYEMLNRIFPRPRLLVNTRLNHTAVRLTPDGSRIIVGGRAGMTGRDSTRHAKALHGDLARFIPALASLRFTHCWDGWMGFTFDKMPHFGEHDGVHYALGFCGVGITLGSWLGHRLGKRLLGLRDEPSAIDALPFSTRPFYRGQRWPIAAAIAWQNLMDRLR